MRRGRSAAEKRRIVELTFEAGASLPQLRRPDGVNANHGFKRPIGVILRSFMRTRMWASISGGRSAMSVIIRTRLTCRGLEDVLREHVLANLRPHLLGFRAFGKIRKLVHQTADIREFVGSGFELKRLLFGQCLCAHKFDFYPSTRILKG